MELYDYEKKHIELLRKAACECMVLLKSDGTFPLEKAFPVANHCIKKDDPFKIIYGVEGYFIDDMKDFDLSKFHIYFSFRKTTAAGIRCDETTIQ